MTEDQKNNIDVLDQFIENLIAEKDLIFDDPQVIEDIKAELREYLDERINIIILNNIPEEKIDEFDTILENGSIEEIQLYCQKNIPGLDEIITAELLNFRDIFLENE